MNRKYLVKSPIKYGSELFAIGDTVEMSDADAKRAIEKGSVVAMAAASDPKVIDAEIQRAAEQLAQGNGATAAQLANAILESYADQVAGSLIAEIGRRADAITGERKAKQEAERPVREEAERKTKDKKK